MLVDLFPNKTQEETCFRDTKPNSSARKWLNYMKLHFGRDTEDPLYIQQKKNGIEDF